jgi:hypothetical protein
MKVLIHKCLMRLISNLCLEWKVIYFYINFKYVKK